MTKDTVAHNNGRFGEFGGCYLPESLIAPIQELSQGYIKSLHDKQFQHELATLLYEYAGRPTALTEAARLQAAVDGPRVLLKREDLLHTGAHKINNALGQCLLAKYLGKCRIIAETGAGQHGVATATACAKLGLECVVYMGEIDIQRQAPNVARMELLGAKVIAVKHGAKTLKDAVNEALRDWSAHYETTHYCIGSALGPHPYPQMVAQYQSVIGKETRQACLDRYNQLPDYVIACVGGGSNAIGIFSAFIDDAAVKLIGVEAGGTGEQLGQHAARFRQAKTGVLHGYYSYVLQTDDGQVAGTHSISAGLDYPGVGPQHAELFASKRAEYTAVDDQAALHAFDLLCKTEGIIPALESSHAVAYYIQQASKLAKDALVVINLSGRGDKDLPELFAHHKTALGLK